MNLTDIYLLYVDGMRVGGLLAAIPFMIGLVIGGLYRLIARD